MPKPQPPEPRPQSTLYREALVRFRELFERAQRSSLHEPAAVTLATADADGRPSARVVLLRAFDERGFVVYTNTQSRKGRECTANPWAALCFYWDPLGEQVRVEGNIELVSDAEADAYWAGRPRDSQIGAWASLQSQPLDSHDTLAARVAEFSERFAGREVPRPAHWTGYRVVPTRIEFWKSREARLHERTEYVRRTADWEKRTLYP